MNYDEIPGQARLLAQYWYEATSAYVEVEPSKKLEVHNALQGVLRQFWEMNHTIEEGDVNTQQFDFEHFRREFEISCDGEADFPATPEQWVAETLVAAFGG